MDSNLNYKVKILDAALHEFGSKSFPIASTNTIAKTACVSKGIIFKYFQTKADLFYSVYMRELDIFIDAFRVFQQKAKGDIFEQIIDIILWKSLYTREHPDSANVLLEGVANPPKPIATKFYASIDQLRETSMQSLFSSLKFEHLHEGVTPEKVEKTLNIAMSGLQATYVNKNTSFKDLEAIREESIEFLKIIIRGLEN